MAEDKQPSKGLLFFYRSDNWVSRFLLRGIDTSYIALPEHCWSLAFTTSTLGINSSVISSTPDIPDVSLLSRTSPSVDLGFNAGYRGFGFGYSWDALNAYTRRLNFSLGSKSMGLDFSMNTSTNINSVITISDLPIHELGYGDIVITNANLNLWYALNYAHYSHNAATKQSYIQKHSAGSFLIHASYMFSNIQLKDSFRIDGATKPMLPALMSGMNGMTTRQVAVGLGYGINYTPNKGKFLLHASAAAMLVAYSVNHVSYYVADSVLAGLPAGEPMFTLHPAIPVHVTGTVRAAISWEINKWVHLSAFATGEHNRFRSKQSEQGHQLSLSQWDWKVQATVGVRFGAGRDRVQRAIGENKEIDVWNPKNNRIPKWITGYFWSPKN